MLDCAWLSGKRCQTFRLTFSSASASTLCRALAIGTHSVMSLELALLIRKHCSLVDVRSSVVFVARRSQVLGTNDKRWVVVAHSSQLLVKLDAQRRRVIAIRLLILKPCRRTNLLVALCDPLVDFFHRYSVLFHRWTFVKGGRGASSTLSSRHFIRPSTRYGTGLIGHVA